MTLARIGDDAIHIPQDRFFSINLLHNISVTIITAFYGVIPALTEIQTPKSLVSSSHEGGVRGGSPPLNPELNSG